MIFLYIIAFFAAIIILLLLSPINISVKCRNNKFDADFSYLFFKKKIFPREDKISKQKHTKQVKSQKKSKKAKNKTSSENKNKDKDSSKSLLDKVEVFIDLLKSAKKALGVFTRKIKILRLKADIDISDEDACTCAVKYGKTNIAVYNILAFLCVFFNVKIEHININCVYNKPKSIYNFSFDVRFTPGRIILTGAAFVIAFLISTFKRKKENKNMS